MRHVSCVTPPDVACHLTTTLCSLSCYERISGDGVREDLVFKRIYKKIMFLSKIIQVFLLLSVLIQGIL